MNYISQKIVLFFYFLIFVSLGFKNDAEALASSQYWSSLTYLPIVEYLKNYSSFIILISFVFGGVFYLINSKGNLFFLKNTFFYFFIFLNLLFLIRINFENVDFGLKYLQSIVLYCLVFLFSSKFVLTLGVDVFKIIFLRSIFYFSLFYITINLVTFLSGNGFVIDNPRFFGVTSHPNFIGVNLAICNIVIYNYILGNKKIYWILFLILGLFLQALTGSRTSFVMLFISLFGYLIMINNIKIKIFYTFIFSLFIFLTFFLIDGDQFDRGSRGGNTRQNAWDNMIQIIVNNPIIGVGEFLGNSENSYLRYAATFGVPLGIIFLSFIIFVVSKYYYLAKKNGDIYILLFCLAIALVFGALLEGYLSDLWSFPKLVFIMLIILMFRNNFKSNDFK